MKLKLVLLSIILVPVIVFAIQRSAADEYARTRIYELDRRINVNDAAIAAININLQDIKSKIDIGTGALIVISGLLAGQLVLTWKQRGR